MNFYVDSGGSIIAVDPERVFQGSAMANTIRLVGAFPASATVTVTYILPDGTQMQPQLMTFNKTLSDVVSAEKDLLFSIWEQNIGVRFETQDGGGVQAIPDYTVLSQVGNVGVVFTVSQANENGIGITQTTARSSFICEKGKPLIMPSEAFDEYESLLNQILSQLSVVLQAGMDNAQAIEALQETTQGLEENKVNRAGDTMTGRLTFTYGKGIASENGDDFADVNAVEGYSYGTTTENGVNMTSYLNAQIVRTIQVNSGSSPTIYYTYTFPDKSGTIALVSDIEPLDDRLSKAEEDIQDLKTFQDETKSNAVYSISASSETTEKLVILDIVAKNAYGETMSGGMVYLPNFEPIVDSAVEKANEAVERSLSANQTALSAQALALQAQQGVSFTDYETMIAALNSLPAEKYPIGQSIYLETVNVPDLWVSKKEETQTLYNYTSDTDFVTELQAQGYVQVGYFRLAQLETGKVNLDYTKVTVNGSFQNIWDADVKADKTELANYLKKADFNLENGNGNGSIKQKGTVTVGGYSGNIKAQAQGPASVALNGLYSPRQGLTPESDGVIAAGPGSFAGGKDTKSYQACSFAFGGGNKAGLTEAEFNAKYSSGKDAHGKTYAESYSFATAEGVTTKATGYAAHAENESTEASGHRSHASGQETHATGDRSFATGYLTNATNQNSFTMGEATDATGINSLAGGFNSTSSGYCSLAFGENCTASNNDAVAIGYYSQAQGQYSLAAGRACLAGGEATVAVGRSNKTTIDYQFACGKYCTENTQDALLVVGNGDDADHRGNAFVVMEDGRAKVYKGPEDDEDVATKAYVDDNIQRRARIEVAFTPPSQGISDGAFVINTVLTSAEAAALNGGDIVDLFTFLHQTGATSDWMGLDYHGSFEYHGGDSKLTGGVVYILEEETNQYLVLTDIATQETYTYSEQDLLDVTDIIVHIK